MHFVYPSLTLAFFLVLVPLIIHLINLMRHRRVEWAAMEFLLAAYKKHRKWVWLKQLLLLLARMAAIAAVVAMLAKLVTPDQWAAIIGGKPTHHYILLDDSYSMSDRAGSETAFDRARRVLGDIAQRAANQDTRQLCTLVRFSHANRLAGQSGVDAGLAGVADLNAVVVDADFDILLEERRREFDVTQLAPEAAPALSVVRQLLDEAEDENTVVYVVSDFRARQWDNPAELKEALKQLRGRGAEVHLVRCVDDHRPNLAIVDLQPAGGTLAAGVPLLVDVTVRNFGAQTARNAQVQVQSVFHRDGPQEAADGAGPKGAGPKVEAMPTLLIDAIEPGRAVTRQVEVFFPEAGRHVVRATLPDDPVATDNRRWCVVDIPSDVPVLLVDGSAGQRGAYFIESALAPGGKTKTGIRPVVRTPAFLRDSQAETLLQYRAVYLLDVDRLDPRAVANVEGYVRRGGGLGVFLGPNSNIAFYNDLYRDAAGPFPVKLARLDALGPRFDSSDADLELTAADHTLFAIFAGEKNRFVRGIAVDRYYRAADDWSPPEDSTIQTVASLRNGRPLVVERQFGQGRVVAFLTTATPDWNNFSRYPSFVVVMLQLQAHLAEPRRAVVRRTVGSPIEIELDAKKYDPDIQFVVPAAAVEETSGNAGAGENVIAVRAARPRGDSPVLAAALGQDARGGRHTDRAGVYEARLVTTDNETRTRRFAINVEPSEGDLALLDGPTLIERLDPVPVTLHEADDVAYEVAEQAGFHWSEIILYGLVCLLLAEQALAYSAGYHPAKGGVR